MEIIYSPQFLKSYQRLPKRVKQKAERLEKQFRTNPFTASLRTHRLKGRLKGLYSFSINYYYRIIFEFDESGEVVYFHDVGTHDIY